MIVGRRGEWLPRPRCRTDRHADEANRLMALCVVEDASAGWRGRPLLATDNTDKT
jgi:hypothetical protein